MAARIEFERIAHPALEIAPQLDRPVGQRQLRKRPVLPPVQAEVGAARLCADVAALVQELQ